MTAQAFIDESARGRQYFVVAAVIANSDVTEVRKLARSLCMPGQRRWHFINERDSRRRQIVDALIGTGELSVLVATGRGRDSQIRPAALRRLVDPLLEHQVGRLLIESRQGRDHLDRIALLSQLVGHHDPADLEYDHLPAHSDPMLWVADAFAWCSSAGGQWAEWISPAVVGRYDVNP